VWPTDERPRIVNALPVDSWTMTEREWKVLRDVKQAALERLCGRILEQCQAVMQGEGTNHERYLRLYETVHEGDDDIARGFNDLKRSTALVKLEVMVRLGLVTDDKLARFDPGTQDAIRFMVGRGSGRRRGGGLR